MTTTTQTSFGRVARVTGPVVDVEFPVEGMPALYHEVDEVLPVRQRVPGQAPGFVV